MENTIAQRLFIAMGKIAMRSDVRLLERRVNMRGYPFKPRVWDKLLPADMLAFYAGVNGMVYAWTFNDEDNYHGPFMPALSDGKKTINLRSRRYALPLIKVGAFTPLKDQFDCPIDNKLQLLLFDGSDDAAGAAMLFDGDRLLGVFRYDNDGGMVRFADSFAEAMQQGIELGFCHMYRHPGHAIPVSVAERLAVAVAPRKTYTLTIDETCDCDNNEWRRWLGTHADYHVNPQLPFDDAMKLMRRKERFATTTAQQRGDLFVELFSDPGAVDDSKAARLRVLSLHRPYRTKKSLTREDFAAVFRCHDEPLTRVRFTLSWDLPADIQVREDGEEERAFLSVDAFKSLRAGCPFDPDIARFCPPSLYPERWSPLVGKFGAEELSETSRRGVAFIPRAMAADIKVGAFEAPALPSITHDLG